jgi:hypothetical protein
VAETKEIKLDFTGGTEELRAALQQTRDLLVEIRDISQQSSKTVQADAQKNVQATERLNEALRESVAATAILGKAGADTLTKSLDEAADSAERLETSAESGAETMKNAFEEIVIEAKKVAKEQGVVVKGLDEQKAATIDLLRSIGAMTKEESKLAKEAIALVDAFEKQRSIADAPVESFKSLRVQIREAKQELDRLIESSDGRITPELIAAAQRAGELDDRFKDLNATVAAFNPDQRLRPVIGILNNVASGFQAATAAAGLLGSESENVGRALLKIQQTVAFVQGLQGFLGGLQDNLKNIRTLIIAGTAAQRAATVATAADAAAKGTQAAATAAASATTVTFTGAVKGLTTALLANPFTAIAVALLAIGAALVSVLSDTEDFKEGVDNLIASLDKLSESERIRTAQKERLQLLQNEIDLIKSGRTEQAQRIKDEEDFQARRARLVADRSAAQQDAISLERDIARARLKGVEEEDEALQALVKRQEDALKEFFALNNDVEALNFERTRDQKANEEARNKNARDAAKKRRDIEEHLANELLAIERDLQKRVRAAEVEEADPRRKLELQRDAAIQEVRILEQTLKRKIALIEIQKRIGIEAFQELTEAQKQARADALIDTGVIQLSLKQTEQIQALQMLALSNYYDGVSDLERANVEERLKIQQEGNEKELAQLEIELSAIARKQREAGSTEAQILAFKQNKRAKLRRELALKDLELEEQIAIAAINQRERNGVAAVLFERQKQIDIIKVQIEFAQRRLDAIKVDGTKETEALRQNLRATIAGLRSEVEKLEKEAPELDIFDLLGLDFTEQDKQRIIGGLQQIISIASAVTAAAQAEVQANINATDQIIDDRERRVSELSRLVEAESEKAKLGQANNEDLLRQRLAAEQRAAEEDKRRRRELIAEQRRLAKQQLAIDAVIQGSALITAAATALARAAKEGGIAGIIAAIGSIAAMIAFFIGIQQQARAITNSEGSTLAKGGMIEGPRHSKGGVPIPGTKVVAEGGEWVTNRKSTRKHLPALEAINSDKFNSPAFTKWLSVQLADSGVSLDRAVVDQIVQDKREYVSEVSVSPSMDTKRLERRVDEVTAELMGLRSDIAAKEQRYQERGKTVVVKGNKTTRKR